LRRAFRRLHQSVKHPRYLLAFSFGIRERIEHGRIDAEYPVPFIASNDVDRAR
jgi:hypothetical protein